MTVTAQQGDGHDALRAALEDAALWLEAEADHPRPDPHQAMRLQASLIRAALRATPTQSADPTPPPLDAGHRTKEPHDCFLMNCRVLGDEVASLQARLAVATDALEQGVADRAERGLPLDVERRLYVLARLIEEAQAETRDRRLNVAVRVAVNEAAAYARGGYSSGHTRDLEAEYAARLAADPQSPTGGG